MSELIGRIVVTVLAAYFLGNLNGAITVSNLLDKDDVRTHGSGNAGMTNYMRSYGLKKTGLVIIIDLGKSILACFLGALLLGPYGYRTEGALLAGVCVSLGHDFPLLLGFQGGKGILCGLGALLVADWRIALISLGVFAIAVIFTRFVSLGSCLAALTLGICFLVMHWGETGVIIMSWIITVTAIFMHRGNIKRLLHGTEKKLTFHREAENT